MEDGSCTFADVDRMNSNSLTTLPKNQFMRSDLILHDVKKFQVIKEEKKEDQEG